MYSYLKVPVRKLKISHFSDLSLGLCGGLCTECAKTHGNIILQRPKCNITILPEVRRPSRRHPSWRSPWHLKSMKKGIRKRIAQKVPTLGTLLATPATKKEYSRELGSQNGSKMEPKMEPRQQRPILTKHAQASTDRMSPSLGAPFSLVFPRPEKYHQKVNIITPICEPGSKMAPKCPSGFPKWSLKS